MLEWVDISLLLFGAFLAGIVTGLTGFGTALTTMALWLYVIPPVLAAPLVAFCSLSAHLTTIRKIWPDVQGRAALPYLAGAFAGIPLGVWLLTWLEPSAFRLAVGIMLIGYPLFALLVKQPLKLTAKGVLPEAAIGVFSGVCGGLAGLSGPILVVWSQLSQWHKERARALLQVINMSIFIAAIATYAVRGLISMELLKIVAICFPGTLAGAWIGLRLYLKIDQETFRRVVLVLLMISGLGLILPRLL